MIAEPTYEQMQALAIKLTQKLCKRVAAGDEDLSEEEAFIVTVVELYDRLGTADEVALSRQHFVVLRELANKDDAADRRRCPRGRTGARHPSLTRGGLGLITGLLLTDARVRTWFSRGRTARKPRSRLAGARQTRARVRRAAAVPAAGAARRSDL